MSEKAAAEERFAWVDELEQNYIVPTVALIEGVDEDEVIRRLGGDPATSRALTAEQAVDEVGPNHREIGLVGVGTNAGIVHTIEAIGYVTAIPAVVRELALWVSAYADLDVVKAAEAAGVEHRFSLAGMAIRTPPSEAAAGPGIELARVVDAAGAADFARVHGELFEAGGRPFEAAEHFASAGVLLAPNVVGYVAYLDGRPVSCAMTVHTGRIAGLFEVATSTDARKRGLGELVSRAATRAGFELGAEAVVLQATALGEPVYRRLGFEKSRSTGPVGY